MGEAGGGDGARDWNEVLRRVLAPFRSEAAAFRVLLVVAALAAVAMVVLALTRGI